MSDTKEHLKGKLTQKILKEIQIDNDSLGWWIDKHICAICKVPSVEFCADNCKVGRIMNFLREAEDE